MRDLPKGEGGGLYLEVAPSWVWMGGGLYMPSNQQLRVIRSHIAATHPRLHRLVTTSAFRRTIGTLEGERLSRVPRGYATDHPAAHYLRFKQFLAGRECEADFAIGRTFYRELLATFRAVAPVVRFLNGALTAADSTPGPGPRSVPPTPGRPQTAAHRPVPAPMW